MKTCPKASPSPGHQPQPASWTAHARVIASDWSVRLLCIASAVLVALLAMPLPFRPWETAAPSESSPATGMALARNGDDPVARLIHRLAQRLSSGEQDVNVAAAARLSGIKAHPGFLHFLRVGTWRMAAADAVEANPWISDNALAAALARAGAPPDEITHVIDHYPVLVASGNPSSKNGWAPASAPAYPRIVRAIEDAMARAGTRHRCPPETFNRLVAEGLRCAWLSACSAGTLIASVTSPEQAASVGEMGSIEEEEEDLRRQAADLARWCADFMADRLIERLDIDPAMALQLARDFSTSGRTPPATTEQFLPPRRIPGH